MKKTQKKTWKPGKYDWGKLSLELLVVFLGVTAGFLLNNWRMNLHDKQLERSYHAGLVEDAAQNQMKIQSSLTMDSLWLSQAAPMLGIFAERNFPIDSAESAIELMVLFHRFEANTNTYQNIINSGNLNIIEDYHLRKQIIEYQDIISVLSSLDDIYYSFYRDFTIPFVINEFNIAKGMLIHKTVSNPALLVNIFSMQYWMIQERQEHYKKLMLKSYELQSSLIKKKTRNTL